MASIYGAGTSFSLPPHSVNETSSLFCEDQSYVVGNSHEYSSKWIYLFSLKYMNFVRIAL